MAASKSAIPKGYDPRAFPPVAVTVDMVVLTIADDALQVLLVERGGQPFKGEWALPGGFIHQDESLDDAAKRELTEETGSSAAPFLEQFHCYGDPGRDPRMRVVTVGYLAIVPDVGTLCAGTDAQRAELVEVEKALHERTNRKLAFDHTVILQDALERARLLLETTSVATAFVGNVFTLKELRDVYEIVWGQSLDPGNFRRKVLSTPRFVLQTGKRAQPGPAGGKPPDLFRKRKLTFLDPPLRRPVR